MGSCLNLKTSFSTSLTIDCQEIFCVEGLKSYCKHFVKQSSSTKLKGKYFAQIIFTISQRARIESNKNKYGLTSHPTMLVDVHAL